MAMKRLLFTLALAAIVAGHAYAQTGQKSKPHTGVTTGMSSGASGFSDRPQSPVSNSSGPVTHSDEQAKGLVPGNPNADGGPARNLGR
jgi:hypothetical protein